MSEVILQISTPLAATADEAWSLITKPATFEFVTHGLLRFRDRSQLPEEWHAGQTIRSPLVLCGFLPAWTHELRVQSRDDANRTLQTAESGGPLRRWDHTLAVTPNAGGGATYTDTIHLEAGPLTPLAGLMARMFFHYRQSRLRRLARAGPLTPGYPLGPSPSRGEGNRKEDRIHH
jgi:hypothetical protein